VTSPVASSIADDTVLHEADVSESAGTEGRRLPEAAHHAEPFEAVAMLDEEERHHRVAVHSDDVGAGALHERSRFEIDDVARAAGGNEEVLAVRHDEHRRQRHLGASEAGEP
jgi:hypothetical protein